MRTACVFITLLAGARIATGMTDEQVASARREVAKQYASIIKQVQATPASADDIAMARQLLAAAGEGSGGEAARLGMIAIATDLLLPLDGQQAGVLIRQAMDASERIRPYSPLARCRIMREATGGRLARAEQRRASQVEIRPLSRAAVEADLAYVEAAAGEEDIPRDADAALLAARSRITQYGLNDLLGRLGVANEKLRNERTWRMHMRQAEAKLKETTKGKDPRAITAASRVLGNLVLDRMGDVTKAARYFSAMGTDEERAVLAGASFLENPESLDADSCLAAAEYLARKAVELESPAKGRLAECALAMCEHYEAGKPSVIGGTKAKVLMGQLEVMLGRTPGDTFWAMVEREFGKLYGKREWLGDKRVRVTYDFSDAAQAKDWQAHDGAWEAGKGMLGCKTVQYGRGHATSKLRFCLDRPFRISMQAKADNEVGLHLALGGSSSTSSYAHNDYASFVLDKTYGLQAYVAGERHTDPRAKLVKGKLYTFELVSGLDGDLVWLVNGEKIRSFKKSRIISYTSRKKFGVRLFTEGSDYLVTTFDNVVIEGEVAVLTEEEAEAARKAKEQAEAARKAREAAARAAAARAKAKRKPGKKGKKPPAKKS